MITTLELNPGPDSTVYDIIHLILAPNRKKTSKVWFLPKIYRFPYSTHNKTKDFSLGPQNNFKTVVPKSSSERSIKISCPRGLSLMVL